MGIVNGKTYSHAVAEFDFSGSTGGAIVNGSRDIEEISYNQKVEVGKFQGSGRLMRARTPGTYSAEGKIKISKELANEIRTALGAGYMFAEFDILVKYGEGDLPILRDELRRCRISDDGSSSSGGTDPLTEEWSLDIFYVIKNGIEPIPNMQRL